MVGSYLNALGWISPEYSAKKALDIFCTPRKGKILPHQQDYLNTADHRWLPYKNHPIRLYHWKGSKNKIFLCHGWESNAARWKKLIEFLKGEDFDIYALDGPAHGASGDQYFNGVKYAEYINVAISEIQPEVLIGHSVGAFSCILAQAHQQNESVKKMVLLGGLDKMTKITNTYFQIIGLGQRVSQKYTDMMPHWFGHPIEYYTASQFADQLLPEGLIIHDNDDRINFFEDAVAIHEVWKNSKLVATNGLGHGLQSPIVYRHILDFIRN